PVHAATRVAGHLADGGLGDAENGTDLAGAQCPAISLECCPPSAWNGERMVILPSKELIYRTWKSAATISPRRPFQQNLRLCQTLRQHGMLLRELLGVRYLKLSEVAQLPLYRW